METIAIHSLSSARPDAGRDAVLAPSFGLAYNGKSISDPIARNLLSMHYTDNLSGEADELTVRLEDTVGNFKRLWYPEKGATLTARMGYPGLLLDCGEFQIDEVHQTGSASGDEVTMRALAAGLATQDVRTKKSKAHESQTLAQIVERVAKAHGLTVVGNIKPITIQRATQFRKTDLHFLHKLAFDYGYVFSVRGKRLVFANIFDLEKSSPVAVLSRADIISYDTTDKLTETFKAAEVQHHNHKTKKLVKGRAVSSASSETAADTLQIRRKVESQPQADAQAKAALHWKNSHATECAVTLPGNPLLVSGVAVRLTPEDFGRAGGLYYIFTSAHHIETGDGYVTEFTGKRLGK